MYLNFPENSKFPPPLGGEIKHGLPTRSIAPRLPVQRGANQWPLKNMNHSPPHIVPAVSHPVVVPVHFEEKQVQTHPCFGVVPIWFGWSMIIIDFHVSIASGGLTWPSSNSRFGCGCLLTPFTREFGAHLAQHLDPSPPQIAPTRKKGPLDCYWSHFTWYKFLLWLS